jgi:transcriptional regulator with XRE-family HTH domain
MSKRRKHASPNAIDEQLLRSVLGAAVRDARSASPYSRQELLDRVGISAQAWSRIECAHCFPSIPTAFDLYRELGLSLDEVFAKALRSVTTTSSGP